MVSFPLSMLRIFLRLIYLYFNMKHKIFNNKTKTYTFNYMIYTDGYGTSVQFIEEEQLEKIVKNIVNEIIEVSSQNIHNEKKKRKILNKNRR